MERKIKWFVFEHYVGYTITDLLMKYFTVFAVGFIIEFVFLLAGG